MPSSGPVTPRPPPAPDRTFPQTESARRRSSARSGVNDLHSLLTPGHDRRAASARLVRALPRHAHGECRATARAAFDRDLAPMCPRQPLADREPEARAAFRPRACLVDPIEALEEVRQG